MINKIASFTRGNKTNNRHRGGLCLTKPLKCCALFASNNPNIGRPQKFILLRKHKMKIR